MDYEKKRKAGLAINDYEMFLDYCAIVNETPDNEFNLVEIIKKIAKKYQVYTNDTIVMKIKRAMEYELMRPLLPIAKNAPYQKLWYNKKKQ